VTPTNPYTIDDIESEIEESDRFRGNIQFYLIKLEEKLNMIYSKSSQSTTNDSNVNHEATGDNESSQSTTNGSNVNSQAAGSQGNTTKGPQIKLPKIDLKKFNGELSKWQSFWDTFEASIHNNHNLAPIDKFNYLNSLLQGIAADSIAGLSFTSSNYDEAVAILQRRFGNKQLIINRHMDILLNLNAAKSSNSVKELRQLYGTIESHVRSLRDNG